MVKAYTPSNYKEVVKQPEREIDILQVKLDLILLGDLYMQFCHPSNIS